MKFEWYVLNYDFNKKKVINFNIFDNWKINDAVRAEVEKYIVDSQGYTYYTLHGFEAFAKCIDMIIRCEESHRREYEISVNDAFSTSTKGNEKWDCYMQVKPNIEALAREVIFQFEDRFPLEDPETC